MTLLRVSRITSETPLAKAHHDLLAAVATRTRREIAWQQFQPERYEKRALALARDQTKTLAEGEYGAVGLFGQLGSALALHRAPFDIISGAASISSDEIRHADYCAHFAELCAGHSLELEVDGDEVLRATRNLSDHEELDYFILKYSALGETLAGALLTECRRRARDPVAKQLYTSLASDEIHHARFGWYYFAWRAPLMTQVEKQRLADRIAEFVMDLECYFWTGRDAPDGAAADANALGVLDSTTQRSVIRSVMDEELCPGLDAIGLSGSYAWEHRRRATSAFTSKPASLVLPPPIDRRALAVERGSDWLARAVNEDGSLRLTLDGASGELTERGDFYHGRAAIVLMALERVARHPDAAERLRRFLTAEVARVNQGELPEAWPGEASASLGSLALLRLAGIEGARPDPGSHDFGDQPEAVWHAAQVVAALGRQAPASLWQSCERALRVMPWACWTAVAARKLDDQAVLARAVRNLQSALAPLGQQGECQGTSLPLALVAAAIEALAEENSTEALSRVRAGQSYLLRWQVDADTPLLDPALALGAFPLLPNHTTLRADVTAHAVLALHAPE